MDTKVSVGQHRTKTTMLKAKVGTTVLVWKRCFYPLVVNKLLKPSTDL